MLITFRPVEHVDYNWITAVYKNGDISDFSLDNLDWEFEGYTPPIDPNDPKNFNVFVNIPGFSRYDISPSGIIRNCKTGDYLTTGLSSVGYKCCRVADDFGKSTYVGVHHLMARALLAHPIDVDQLVVNHKDGNKTENTPRNLEWVSYSKNIAHAYYTGLRDEIVPVYIKNKETGETKSFMSISNTAKFFGNCSAGKIHRWLHIEDKHKPHDGWFVSLTDDWDF